MVDLLLGEVNDDLRRERLMMFLRRWRKPLIYGALALIIGTAGSSIRDHYRAQSAMTAMQMLADGREAFAARNFVEAEHRFATLESHAHGDVRDMATLWRARSLRQQQKSQEANTALLQLAQSPAGGDALWRDLACIELAPHQPLPAACTTSESSPLKPQRMELAAVALLASGRATEAIALLEPLREDAAITATARVRVEALLDAARGMK